MTLQLGNETLHDSIDEATTGRQPAGLEPYVPPPTGRGLFFHVLIAGTFLILVGQIIRLQVLQGNHYATLADQNRFRQVSIEAPRGIIYDRNGVVLVRNSPTFEVSITPGALPADQAKTTAIYHRLSDLLGVPITTTASITDTKIPDKDLGIAQRVARGQAGPYKPVLIATNVDREKALILMEAGPDLPGVEVSYRALRDYPTHSLLATILGFVGPIPSAQVDEYKNKGYDPNTDRIGISGLEYSLEDILRGTKGQQFIEEDILGHKIRDVGEPVAPVAGDNIILSIDSRLQQAARDALEQGMKNAQDKLSKGGPLHPVPAGVVVAMDPRNGEILAMVSLPTYDNNLFARGISAQDYQLLSQDPYTPLVNQAISGQYPPGSTFKIVPTSAALQEGVITVNTYLFDPGVITLPGGAQFVCWNRSGHGSLNVIGAIANSCDVFMYKIGGGYAPDNLKGLGINRLASYARSFGFGKATGIELPGEADGLVPDDKWKRHTVGENWYTGDTYNMSIGQGYVLVTPLQLLNATAAVVNGGTLYRPHLVHQIVDGQGHVVQDAQSEAIGQVSVSPENLDMIRQGMRAVITRGTADFIKWPQGLAVAGKTGTAEYCDDLARKANRCQQGNWPTHAWFTAFAPYDNPQIVLAVFLYNGGQGSENAAPIASRILAAYFHLPDPTAGATPMPGATHADR